MKFVRGLLATVVVAIVLGAAGLFGLYRAGLLPGRGARIDSTTISSSFADIAELATEEYNFTNVGKYTEGGSEILGIDVPFTGGSFLITYSGTVKAGIADVTQAGVDVNDAARTVTVSLPAVQVLSSTIDPETVETYDQSFSLVNQLEVSDVTAFLASEEEKAQTVAVDNVLLDKARTRAEALVTSQVKTLLTSAGAADYTVSVTWVEPSAPPAS